MKVLLNCGLPFSFAHGGAQIQIEQTKLALEQIGVEVEFLRWWDDAQTGDILQWFGRPPAHYVAMAQKKGLKVVILDLLSAQGSHSGLRLWLHKIAIKGIRAVMPKRRAAMLTPAAYITVDACIANTPCEANIMSSVYGAPPERVHVVPNGVEDIFFQSPKVDRGSWLVCTGTITQRKRILELAQAAVEAKTPLWVVGKPYSEDDPYFKAFALLAKENPDLIRYEGAIGDRATMAKVYREARGFVLLSTMETRSLSSEEAAACECPLLLSDLPWARDVFGAAACYSSIKGSLKQTAKTLREFYDAAPTLPPPTKPMSWTEVAGQFREIYRSVLEEPTRNP